MRKGWVIVAALLAACGQAQPPPARTFIPALPTTLSTSPASHALTATSVPPADAFTRRRQSMVKEQIQARDVSDLQVLEAMNTIPRHLFVPQQYLEQAYADHPLPIGYGQTISQPYIVALMTEKLKIKRGDKALEIGTGSGYQAAVLAHLGLEVYSVEIVPELARAADERLKQLGYAVSVKQGDGYLGWEEYAPYDAIIVTAAPDHVPQPLVKQLKDGGRLVIPVGPQGFFQTLWQFTRQGGELQAVDLGGVSFVPLVRGQ